MAVTPPPRKNTAVASEAPARKVDDKQIEAIINRGGSSRQTPPKDEQDTIKNFNIKVAASTLASIDEVRAMRPRKPTSPKLGVSTQDWLLEAIAEKLERERKKYLRA